MDWQAIYLLALAGASWPFLRSPWLVLIMWANLGACHLVEWDMTAVAVIDLTSAAALMFGTARMVVVASLFLAMVPLHGLAIVEEWRPATTYAIVDVLAYGQLLIVGRADAGMGRMGRYLRGRLAALVGWPGSDKGSVAVVSRPDRKVRQS